MMKPTLKLYELTDHFLDVLDDLCEQDLLPDIIALQLEELAGAWEHKALNVARYIKNLEAEAAAVTEAGKRMDARAKTLNRQAANMREYLKHQIEITGMKPPHATDLTLRIQNNPPSVVIHDALRIPADYRRSEIVTTILKAEISTALKAGKTVTGAHLEQGTRLVIG
jgi:hypothetical protein